MRTPLVRTWLGFFLLAAGCYAPVQTFGAAFVVPIVGGGGGTITGAYAAASPLLLVNNTNITLPLELATAQTNLIAVISNQNTLYVTIDGNNTTAKRGRPDKPWRDPRAAVLAASAGDWVVIGPGRYATNNLWKPGVNIHGLPGSHIGKTNAAAGLGIIDDRNGLGAGTNYFIFEGTLAYESDASSDTQVDGPFVITNANSIAVIKGNRIESQFYDVRTFGCSPFVILDCRYVSIDFDTITDNMNGINDSYGSICYWENGRTHLNFKNADMDNGYGFWFKEPAGTPASDIYVTGQRMTTATAAGNPVLVQFTGTNANWKAWIDVQEMAAPGGGGYGIAMDGTGGKLYVKTSKAGNVNTALQLLGGEYWGTMQKVSVADGGFLTASGGSSFHLVQHWEDIHTQASIGPAFLISGGHHTFYPSVARVQDAKALSQSGGTSRWVNVTLDSVGTNKLVAATNNVPVWVTGGRVELVNCTLIAPTNAYAIDSPTPQTVYVYGTLTANRPISPNITIATILTNHISDLWVHGPWRATGEFDQFAAANFWGATYFDAAVNALQGQTWTLPHVVAQDSVSSPVYHHSGGNIPSNSLVRVDAQTNLAPVTIGANLNMAANGTLSATGGGSGGTNFPPVINTLGLTNVTVGSGVRQARTFTTNASFGLNFSGTALNGETVSIAVSNHSAADIFMTNYVGSSAAGIYDPTVGSNVTQWVIMATSIRYFDFRAHTNFNNGTVRWENIGGAQKGYALVAGADLEFKTNGSTITVQSTRRTTNYADASITINLSTDVFAQYTNAVAGNRSITIATPVIGKSFSLGFKSDGSARTLPVLTGAEVQRVWLSTNDTATATNVLTTASKRGLLMGRAETAEDGFSTNLLLWTRMQKP